jgi:two-component system, response regulator YesN
MKKILIVDDEHDVRSMLEEFLVLKGYEVKTAADGMEALKFFDDFNPDIAIVDIKMPNMDGPTFSKYILEKNASFPIIIITGFAAQYNIEEIKELGIKKILLKPLVLETLSEEIKQYLS